MVRCAGNNIEDSHHSPDSTIILPGTQHSGKFRTFRVDHLTNRYEGGTLASGTVVGTQSGTVELLSGNAYTAWQYTCQGQASGLGIFSKTTTEDPKCVPQPCQATSIVRESTNVAAAWDKDTAKDPTLFPCCCSDTATERSKTLGSCSVGCNPGYRLNHASKIQNSFTCGADRNFFYVENGVKTNKMDCIPQACKPPTTDFATTVGKCNAVTGEGVADKQLCKVAYYMG